MATAERQCKTCGQVKPLDHDHFYHQGSGYTYSCCDCMRKRSADYRSHNHERINEAQRVRQYRDRKRREQLEIGQEKVGQCYTVKYDPDTSYGFCAGVKLPNLHVREMLRLGCFTPGTILISSRRRKVTVIGMNNQKLVELVP